MIAIRSDEIFAPATVPERAAVAIVPLSGSAAREVCRRLTGRPPPAPRHAALRRVHDPQSGEPIDQAMVLWFAAPASFTGEVLELQVHGGRAVLGALMDAMSEIPGLRPAEPGEFTRRAFLNGRLDLTAADGLADLIVAETRAQARQALRQLDGALGTLYESSRLLLLGALARLEAEFDFAPEEDVPEGMLEAVRPEVSRLSAEIAAHLSDGDRASGSAPA